MDFIAKNWQLIFGGLGTAVIAAVVGAWAKAYFEKPKPAKKNEGPAQSIRSGSNSVNVQSGRDMNVGGKSE
jgi:hypothetical protein